VASAFNRSGANADVATGAGRVPSAGGVAGVWTVADGEVRTGAGSVLLGDGPPIMGEADAPPEPSAGPLHLARVLIALAVMLVPGALAFRRLVPDGGAPEALAMVPALAIALLTLSGIVVVAVLRAPLQPLVCGAALGVALAAGALARRRASAP